MPKYSKDLFRTPRGLHWRDATGPWHLSPTQRERLVTLRRHAREEPVARMLGVTPISAPKEAL